MVKEIVPLGNWFILTESPKRPSLMFGFSSDRIGTTKGNLQYYLVVGKYLPWLRLAPYAGIQYSDNDEGINYPFGANIEISSKFSLMPMYDGNRSHLVGNYYINDRVGLSLLWLWYEQAGISVFVGF
ncbi:MAG: hypothetical protein SGI97_05145 [candidate division Zixibacteria bacterium]|nr:hypothetical protein [candidate division Zixibacteria bacterium]